MRTSLVTGASAGIGLETARGLAMRGDRVLLVGRNPDKTRAAANAIETESRSEVRAFVADFSSLAEVRTLAAQVREATETLDVLVNNAGLWHRQRRVTADGFEETMAVNHLAPYLLTTSLLDLLKASPAARVVTVSSRLHRRPSGFDFDDPFCERKPYRGLAQYSMSKLANVLFANELARRLEHTTVTSNSLHPGEVATNVVRDSWLLSIGIRIARPFLMSAREGAATSLHVATAPALDRVSGHYFRDCRSVPCAPAAQDIDAAARLWRWSDATLANALDRA